VSSSRVAATFRSRGSEFALRLGVFDSVRWIYHVLLNRKYRRELADLRLMFRPFIAPGSLVFDVGANKGELTAVFSQLRATVVSVEPNPALAEHLRRRFRNASVVEAAVGSNEGTTTLHLGVDSGHSTVSGRWRVAAKGRNRFSGSAVPVPVTTLDALIERYGMPAFVKIDVEGSELAVLRGLTTPVQALCFEFQSLLLDELPLSFEAIEALGAYQFGRPEGTDIKWADWPTVMGSIQSDCARGAESGDVFARLASA
jgi:FkbM family methyltransferase